MSIFITVRSQFCQQCHHFAYFLKFNVRNINLKTFGHENYHFIYKLMFSYGSFKYKIQFIFFNIQNEVGNQISLFCFKIVSCELDIKFVQNLTFDPNFLMQVQLYFNDFPVLVKEDAKTIFRDLRYNWIERCQLKSYLWTHVNGM